MPTPESRVKAKVKKLLASYADLYSFMPVPTAYQAASLDWFVCYCRRFIAIETKAPGKKPTPRQQAVIRKIIAAGGEVFVVSNDDELLALKLFLDNLY